MKQTANSRSTPVSKPAKSPKAAKPAKQTASRFVEAVGVTIDKDEDDWRPLTGDNKRDLSPVKQKRMQELARYQWESNLLANTIIELPVAYLLAQGVTLTSEDEEAQKHLTRFWNDPINEMDLKLPKKVRELSVYGEQCYPVFVNQANGRLRIGYLNPTLIETVVTDPDNAEQPIGIVTVKDKKGEARRYRVIINGPESSFTGRTQEIRQTFDAGEAFFFKVNDLSDGSRGRSDLLAQIDWLDAYEDYLFGELDRAKFLRTFLWDVELTGATPEEVKMRAKEITAPSPGAVRVHNDAEKWHAETPALQAGDSSEMARLVRNHVLGGSRLPSHWFGGGEDANRATAGEMSEPTFKSLSMRQRFLKYMLEMIGRYQLRKAFKVGEDEEIDLAEPKFQCQAVFPEMVARDISKFAAALGQAATAAAILVDKGFITRQTAVRMLGAVITNLGVDIDPEEELKNAEEELKKAKEARDAADTLLPNPPDIEEGQDGNGASEIGAGGEDGNQAANKMGNKAKPPKKPKPGNDA